MGIGAGVPGAGAAGSPGLAGVLRPLAARVLGIAAGVPFQPQRAAGIGAALVEANVTGSEALGRTLTVIGRHLARAGETPGSTRVSAVLEALAGGYVRALVGVSAAARSADRPGQPGAVPG